MLRKWTVHMVIVQLAGVLAGCEADRRFSAVPPAGPPGRDRALLPGTSAGPRAEPPAGQGPSEPTGDLTLRDALAAALRSSPQLEGFAWAVRAAEAEALQAGLPPNPELEAEFENFAGSGEFRGTRALETTLTLSQLVELGGKAEKRRAAAGFQARLAGWDYEQRRVAVLTETARRFVDVLAAQEKLVLAREDLRLAEATHAAVGKRVRAGKAAATEESKSSVLVAAGRIRVGRLERELAAARGMLAAMWGSGSARFDRVVGDLGVLRAPPEAAALAPKLAQGPALGRWEDEIAARGAAVALAEAEGIPDLNVGVGYRHARETEDNDRAMLVTVGVPLPVYDRNQGGILKTRAALRGALAGRRAAGSAARASLEKACQALRSAWEQATALRGEVLPAARQAHEAARASFEAGKGGYLDLLDAQRTLIAAREQLVDALAAYHGAVADVEGLIGEALFPETTNEASAKENEDDHDK